MNQKLVAKSNYVLRKVLNSEDNLDILQDFIESILKIKIQKIFLNPYLKSKERYLPKEENFGVADVRVLTNNGEELNIGIQIVDGFYIQSKLLLYFAQIHINQTEYCDNRKKARTITINILDFKYFNSNEYHKKISIENAKDKPKSEKIELHILELPKFTKDIIEVRTKEEKWMKFLKGEDIESITMNYNAIKKLDMLLKKFWKEEKME
jgi:predicted transposase/invertase (TIGR01784 family)